MRLNEGASPIVMKERTFGGAGTCDACHQLTITNHPITNYQLQITNQPEGEDIWRGRHLRRLVQEL